MKGSRPLLALTTEVLLVVLCGCGRAPTPHPPGADAAADAHDDLSADADAEEVMDGSGGDASAETIADGAVDTAADSIADGASITSCNPIPTAGPSGCPEDFVCRYVPPDRTNCTPRPGFSLPEGGHCVSFACAEGLVCVPPSCRRLCRLGTDADCSNCGLPPNLAPQLFGICCSPSDGCISPSAP